MALVTRIQFTPFVLLTSWFWLWSNLSPVRCALLERKFQAPSLCFREADPGPCSFTRTVWYFDHRSRRCSRFPYGGCRGNANRFESRRACLKICTGAGSGNDAIENGDEEDGNGGVTKGNEGNPPVIVIDSWDAICLQEPNTGNCPPEKNRGARYWYFYNGSSGACEEFLYYGCSGNNNRFATGTDCRMACGHLGARWRVQTCDVCDQATSLCSREADWTFWCRCREGFYRDSTGRCSDEDECDAASEKTAKCDQNAWCINTPGSYLCTCMAGFMGDGQRCTKGTVIELPPAPMYPTPTPNERDYNMSSQRSLSTGPKSTSVSTVPLLTTTPTVKLITYEPWLPSHVTASMPDQYDCQKCHKNATCWYGTCQCKKGFVGDGTICQDIDECRSRTARCAPEAACYNTEGSYHCKCPSGSAGTGFFCTRDKNVCLEPLDSQYREQCGEAYFQRRYYYDQRYRQCRMFWYDNCEGSSRNVFPDLDTCRSYCERENGASLEAPRFNPDRSTVAPSAVDFPTSHRRYPSAVVTNSPSGIDRSLPPLGAGSTSPHCLMPCQPGTCYGAYFMYYYNASSRACVPFIYTGCGGNENRFLTKSTCEETCLVTQHAPELDCLQPVDYGYGRYDKKCQPFASYAWFYDQDGDECGRFWYQGCGGNVNRFTTEQECKTKCLDCFQEQKEGYCYYIQNKPRPRYYYDSTDRQCKQFMYNGCGGNTNRFGSLEFCDSTCQQTFKPNSKLCMYWADIGPCNDMQTMWYFDLKTGTCQTFLWSGCGGNMNRFRTRDDCESICISRKENPCSLPKEPGPCAQAQQRFYYDPVFSICRPFIYGGCKGNDNNFHSIDECRFRCERFETALPTLKGSDPKTNSVTKQKMFSGGKRRKTRRRIMRDSVEV